MSPLIPYSNSQPRIATSSSGYELFVTGHRVNTWRSSRLALKRWPINFSEILIINLSGMIYHLCTFLSMLNVDANLAKQKFIEAFIQT